MSRKRRSALVAYDMDINMTPMIDIIFQLLIFFVLTAKFIEFEGELRSYLPKNRGLQSFQTTPDLATVTIFLDWVTEEGGKCTAVTINYKPATGEARPQHQFPTIYPGQGGGYEPNKRVDYPYPDYQGIKDYIRYRKDNYVGLGLSLPVTVNFTDKVPVQMIVNMIDICTELGITDFAINATGIE